MATKKPSRPAAAAAGKVAGKVAGKALTKTSGTVLATSTAKKGAAEKLKSPAEWAYDRLILYIRNFESQLDASQEIALGFAGSDAGVLQIEGLGYFDPDMVTFYGRDQDGLKTQLVQHVNQLSVILRAVPKGQEADPPRRIGFSLNPGWSGGESGDGSV